MPPETNNGIVRQDARSCATNVAAYIVAPFLLPVPHYPATTTTPQPLRPADHDATETRGVKDR